VTNLRSFLLPLSVLLASTGARGGTLDNIYNGEATIGSSYMSLGQPMPQGAYSTQGYAQPGTVPMQTYNPNQRAVFGNPGVATPNAGQPTPMICSNGICRMEPIQPHPTPQYTYVPQPNFQVHPTFPVAPPPQFNHRR